MLRSEVAVLLTSVTAPVPVELMPPVNWLPAWLSVTAPLPARTVVSPVTKAGPLWVTAALVVVTSRLSAAAPDAPIVPRLVASVFLIVTAPVPVELIAPLSWLDALLKDTSLVPALTVAAPVTVRALPVTWAKAPLLVVTVSAPPRVALASVTSPLEMAVRLPLWPVLIDVPELIEIWLATLPGEPPPSWVPAYRLTLSERLAPPAAMEPPLAMLMSPCAASVSVADWEAASEVVMAPLTLMSPWPRLLPPLLVSTTTLEPLVSAAASEAVLRKAPSSVVPKLPVMLVLLPVPMVRSFGSSSQVPPLPPWALPLTSTRPVRTFSVCLPEVSTTPPLPPSAPPRALMRPLKSVRSLAHTTTLPPSPWRVALASMLAPLAMRVVVAFQSSPWPW
mmetsp:Transcript_5967/g.23701  ORF Transcript_5967/g.23701 Transcript_5967/m.23701 type:complete len:392 (+) Transcript_5967:101-1276(+)